jgi:hypothetical protein
MIAMTMPKTIAAMRNIIGRAKMPYHIVLANFMVFMTSTDTLVVSAVYAARGQEAKVTRNTVNTSPPGSL